jgi:hypothetical protein
MRGGIACLESLNAPSKALDVHRIGPLIIGFLVSDCVATFLFVMNIEFRPGDRIKLVTIPTSRQFQETRSREEQLLGFDCDRS